MYFKNQNPLSIWLLFENYVSGFSTMLNEQSKRVPT